MFMVGDPLQKVYDRHINFSSLKISTVGRSKRLLRNYRTTEEIRKDAVKIILSEEFSDFGDSNEKITGYFSIGKGPEPTYIHFNSKEEEIHYVEMKLKELLESGLYNSEDICFAAQKKDTIQEFHTHFHKQGLKINLGVKIGDVKTSKKGVSVAYTDSNGAAQTLDCDRLIVSVGRVPNTDRLNLEAVGLKTDERGFIPVDDHTCETTAPGVYAVGDVIRGPMLAHKAEDEGVLVAEVIAGQKPHIDYNCIPWVIYTSPEIAWVGKTEQQLKAEGRAYKPGQFPFAANGRALGMGQADGFVKVLADAQTDEILGVHIVGAAASDLIAEAAVAMEFKAAAEDIGRVCHPHPSLSEVMREAALATDKRALNM
jgi:hypothetical protein